MGKRGVITDYAGNELYKGDMIAYSTRQANRVRMSDAIVLRATAVNIKGIGLVPRLKIKPLGVESGFTERRSGRIEWINAEHVRLVEAGAVDPETI